MPVPTTNVTLGSIQTEFGGSSPISLSEYYRGGGTGYVPAGQNTSPTDGTAISTSGTIRVGMFRGLTKISPLSISGSTTVQGTNGSFTEGDNVTVTTDSAVMTATGGVTPYTYAWTKVSGADAFVQSPTNNSTTFSRGMIVSSNATGVYRCTVTDSLSATAFADVTVNTAAINLN